MNDRKGSAVINGNEIDYKKIAVEMRDVALAWAYCYEIALPLMQEKVHGFRVDAVYTGLIDQLVSDIERVVRDNSSTA